MAQVWCIRSPPGGPLVRDIFGLENRPDSPLAPGEIRVANQWLSVDPIIRGLPLPLGFPLFGGAVGVVTESREPKTPVGTPVLHYDGWRDTATLAAGHYRVIHNRDVPIQVYLGNLGITGQTAYFGLLDVAGAKEGETVFVSAGAGAVGSAALQIAVIKGMRVIASAAGAEKCAQLRKWGADVAIDRRAPGTMREKLAAAAPEGIDVYFDNVGGDHLDAAIEVAKIGARFALCGMVSSYGGDDRLILDQPMRLVLKRLRLNGFSAPDYDGRYDEFHGDMLKWTLDGSLISAETVFHGLDSVPDAFIGLFDGRNLGKMVVKL